MGNEETNYPCLKRLLPGEVENLRNKTKDRGTVRAHPDCILCLTYSLLGKSGIQKFEQAALNRWTRDTSGETGVFKDTTIRRDVLGSLRPEFIKAWIDSVVDLMDSTGMGPCPLDSSSETQSA